MLVGKWVVQLDAYLDSHSAVHLVALMDARQAVHWVGCLVDRMVGLFARVESVETLKKK